MKLRELLSEVSLQGFGDYAKKARMSKAMAQMNKGFGYEGDHDKTIANREKGLERHKSRVDKFWADRDEKAAADAEVRRHANRDANAARLAQLEKEFDPDYEYSDDHSHWTKHRDINAQIAHLKHAIRENATAGATSAANIGTVVNPHHSPGKARGKKSYLGSPGTGSGTKAPPQPKVVQPKTKAGTAVNGLDIKGASLFGGPANEAAVIKRR